MPCNQVCEKLEYKFVRNGVKSFYEYGASRCNGLCYQWLKYEGLYCPCCGYMLRKNPRSKNGYTTKARIDATRIS